MIERKSEQRLKLLSNDMVNEHQIICKNANCEGCPSEWFFPDIGRGGVSHKYGTPLHKGLTTCSNCTVIKECYNFAVKHECIGVWGGVYFNTIGKPSKKIKIGKT